MNGLPGQTPCVRTGGSECASCGSSLARPIAPNYVECAGVVHSSKPQRVVVAMVPVNGHPRFGMQPIYADRDVPTQRPCGLRHHEPMTSASIPPRCDCGTFAIGLCRDCDAPVCGDDSDRLTGHRVCRPCAANRAAAQRKAAQEEEGRRIHEWEADRLQRMASGREDDGRAWGACTKQHTVSVLPNGRCMICYPPV